MRSSTNRVRAPSKPVASADRLHREITRRLATTVGIEAKCRGLAAPWPIPIDRRGDGVNWTVTAFPPMPAGCATHMMRVLNDLMYAYDLELPAEPPPGERNAAAG